MAGDNAALGAIKVRAMVRKWEGGRTPADGEPDDVIIREHWEEADGTVVTDPARIEQLEARLASLPSQEN